MTVSTTVDNEYLAAREAEERRIRRAVYRRTWVDQRTRVLSSPVFGANPKRIADLTLGHRLPAVTLFPDFARAGGLMAYGPNLLDTYRQLGGMVAKVLRGTKPADLPVELPTKFELVINLKTAKALGIDVPLFSQHAPTRSSNEKARVHHTSRRRGGRVAARGARAGAGANAAHRRAHGSSRGRSGRTSPLRGEFERSSVDWDGPTAGTRASMSDGARALQSGCAVMLRNLSRSCRMSFWHLGVRQSEHCNRRPIPCRSCSRRWPTRLAQVLSRASRGPAATSPASCCCNTA